MVRRLTVSRPYLAGASEDNCDCPHLMITLSARKLGLCSWCEHWEKGLVS